MTVGLEELRWGLHWRLIAAALNLARPRRGNGDNQMDANHRGARFFANAGRIALALASLALIGTWIVQLTGKPLLGMDQQHLANDAIALALLGIGGLLDGLAHTKGL